MTAVRLLTAALAVLVLVAATDLLRPETAGADTPAPIPTTLSIRDVSAPPTPSTQPQPFVSRPTRHRSKRAVKPRRPVASSKAQRTAAPAPMAQNPAAPRLEQRYQAPTEAIYPLEPEPAPAPAKAPEPKPAPGGFPPEPAAAKK